MGGRSPGFESGLACSRLYSSLEDCSCPRLSERSSTPPLTPWASQLPYISLSLVRSSRAGSWVPAAPPWAGLPYYPVTPRPCERRQLCSAKPHPGMSSALLPACASGALDLCASSTRLLVPAHKTSPAWVPSFPEHLSTPPTLCLPCLPPVHLRFRCLCFLCHTLSRLPLCPHFLTASCSFL